MPKLKINVENIKGIIPIVENGTAKVSIITEMSFGELEDLFFSIWNAVDDNELNQWLSKEKKVIIDIPI